MQNLNRIFNNIEVDHESNERHEKNILSLRIYPFLLIYILYSSRGAGLKIVMKDRYR